MRGGGAAAFVEQAEAMVLLGGRCSCNIGGHHGRLSVVWPCPIPLDALLRAGAVYTPPRWVCPRFGATGSAKALRSRAKLPRPIARLPLLKLPAPVGRQPLAYLFDIGFTRDVWMHRIDLAHATGRPFNADAEHDGRILADIIAEWAATHREPFTLELDGPAGGRYTAGSGGEHLQALHEPTRPTTYRTLRTTARTNGTSHTSRRFRV